MTQGPQSQRQMAPNVHTDTTPTQPQAKPATKRFAIVDPKTNKELTADDVVGGSDKGAASEKSAAPTGSDTAAAGDAQPAQNLVQVPGPPPVQQQAPAAMGQPVPEMQGGKGGGMGMHGMQGGMNAGMGR